MATQFIPITEADEAARIILEAVRRNEKDVFIPKRLFALVSNLFNCFFFFTRDKKGK
jgi:hypothetical protein